MNNIVQLKDVKKDYGIGDIVVNALRGVSIELAAGEFTAMAGPSGSGKSTLLNIIGALDRPTSGSVAVEGCELAGMSRTALSRLRRDRIGFVFQNYNLMPVLTVEENAEYVLMLQGVPASERRKRVREVLGEVGLEGKERRFPRELSGGQQQRVAIARALVAEPLLILADEPTANVDSRTGLALIELMARMNRQKGVTFLFSTHDPSVMKHSRRLVFLSDGEVAYDGPYRDDLIGASD